MTRKTLKNASRRNSAGIGFECGLRFGFFLLLSALVFAVSPLPAQIASSPAGSPESPVSPEQEQRREKAAAELRAQEQQRILGIMPNFNTSNVADAEPLSAGQKFDLAEKSALDPFTFAAAGLAAGIGQAENSFPGYRQGSRGYSKRFAAAYLDSLDGMMLGNAVFPMLLKQDPRYFRKGTGSFGSRLAHALLASVECKDDSGRWVPNYSNMLGNIAAGGISNLYYPGADRGLGLTFERAMVVSGEGALGAVFIEFWPDLSRKLFHHRRESDTTLLGPGD